MDGTISGVGGEGRPGLFNIFQLLLVSKADPQDPATAADFDIIFNYDTVQWDNETFGYCPQAGFSAGGAHPHNNTQIAGSGQCGALLDSNSATSLKNHTNQAMSQPDGRWVFSVVAGAAPAGGDIVGRVTDSAGAAVEGASVGACRTHDSAGAAVGFPCRATVTGPDGSYRIPFLPDGSYTTRAFPPSGKSLRPANSAATISQGGDFPAPDLVLDAAAPLPAGTTVTPRHGGVIPWIHFSEETTLETTPTPACEGGTGTWTLTMSADSSTGLPYTTSGPLTEQPANSGHYVGVIPSQYPHQGYAAITLEINCPGGTTSTIEFDANYIDPSGVVMDTKGHLLPDATVILYRSESPTGPFTQVPDQSVIMSPGNRTNPDLTDGKGHFGWDVMPGYYKVRAQAPGCTDPNVPSKTFVETGVLPIPPPVFDLELVLQCPSRPSKVLLTYNDPAPSDPSDPCRSGTTFKRNAVGDHDDLTVCTYDEDGDPLATDTFQSHLEWSIDGAGSAAATVGFNPAPPVETSGAGAVALVGFDALSPGDNFVTVDLVSASGTVLDSFELEKQVRAPTSTRDVVTELTARKKTRFIRGKAKASDAECRAGRTVTLYRRRPGPDPAIGTATTTQSGRWRVRTGRRRGTYYARIAFVTTTDTVTGDTLHCLADQSERVRRR